MQPLNIEVGSCCIRVDRPQINLRSTPKMTPDRQHADPRSHLGPAPGEAQKSFEFGLCYLNWPYVTLFQNKAT